jgi:hypothetical protein
MLFDIQPCLHCVRFINHCQGQPERALLPRPKLAQRLLRERLIWALNTEYNITPAMDSHHDLRVNNDIDLPERSVDVHVRERGCLDGAISAQGSRGGS